ncbi:hypothetical protein [Leifsonia aquatica]|uniref:hypothetical protein n=1 Tax=Leifsonia aquatica TaxID=144185 RepID=UPI00382D036E
MSVIVVACVVLGAALPLYALAAVLVRSVKARAEDLDLTRRASEVMDWHDREAVLEREGRRPPGEIPLGEEYSNRLREAGVDFGSRGYLNLMTITKGASARVESLSAIKLAVSDLIVLGLGALFGLAGGLIPALWSVPPVFG